MRKLTFLLICFVMGSADEKEIGLIDESGMLKELRIQGKRDPVSIEIGDELFFPISDYRGNIRKLIDSQGNVIQSYDYTAFGEELAPIGEEQVVLSPEEHFFLIPWAG